MGLMSNSTQEMLVFAISEGQFPKAFRTTLKSSEQKENLQKP